LDNIGIITRKTLVKNKLGMHVRPASRIAQMVESSNSEVRLCVGKTKVDATSIIDILTLGAVQGTQIIIEVENQDNISILEQIVDFFEAGFGEDL
jgi:phosphocarrier protein HPr